MIKLIVENIMVPVAYAEKLNEIDFILEWSE